MMDETERNSYGNDLGETDPTLVKIAKEPNPNSLLTVYCKACGQHIGTDRAKQKYSEYLKIYVKSIEELLLARESE